MIVREQPKTKYRDIKALNYSGIKTYSQDPIKFYREFVLGEKSEEKTSKVKNKIKNEKR